MSCIDFPCLAMDSKSWIASSSSEEDSCTSAMGSITLESNINNPWLLNGQNKSQDSDSNIMSPVLKETSRNFWLATDDSNSGSYRAPVTDRVPDPETSLWLAASTASISAQTRANNISWKSSSFANVNNGNSKWLDSNNSSVATVNNPLSDWSFTASGNAWLSSSVMTSSTGSSICGEDNEDNVASYWTLPRADAGSSNKNNNPLTGWTMESSGKSWLSQDKPQRPSSPRVEAWLESAMIDVNEQDFEDSVSSGSSIVVLSEPPSCSNEDQEDDDMGFWLL